MTKVLITGGCGFIGSNLVEFILQKTDWQINVLDNLTGGKLEDIEQIAGFKERSTFFKGDIRNKEDVSKAVAGCDYVVNLAAQVGVMPSVEDPLFDADVNIIGTITVLNACVKNKIKKFVQASSAAPLGDQEMPMHEKKVPQPLSPYGASKLADEAYCSAFAASYGLNTVALRFSNAYGIKSYQKGSVIPLFIRQILNGETCTIFGDGEQTRDFIYVTDICNGIYLALTTELKNKFELIQLATGKETSMNELFKVLKQEFEKHGKTVQDAKYVPARPGEIIRNYADITKLRTLLNYEPKVDLKEGISKTVSWFINQ
ncbi:GDP-mannose 4,6-dehydratase [Candidatus Woesearchaeota archaeon]|nr:GDP-mannose 4,6-dehydratase [Candidatus Woesearchaeota archaeon]MBW2994052.1 GDP-mannose 4,6-dehydratase [Candidatus Woesearchaeota archaeon]